MNKWIYHLVLVVLLLGSTAYASNLVVKLNKVSFELDQAEIFAANCVVDAKADKKIHSACIQANGMLQHVNEKLDRITSLNTNNASEIIENIKQLKTKIGQVNEHLTEAKIVTGDYEWTNSFVPSIK